MPRVRKERGEKGGEETSRGKLDISACSVPSIESLPIVQYLRFLERNILAYNALARRAGIKQLNSCNRSTSSKDMCNVTMELLYTG